MFLHIYIAPGRGRQSIGDKILMTTERPFAHMLQVSNWSIRNLILYTFSMILYLYIAPGQGQKTPLGQTFDVNRKSLSLQPFVASFKQISLNSDLIHIFWCFFPHVYSPGHGQTTLCGQNPDVNRKKTCHFAHLLQVSKKYLWILNFNIIFQAFIHVYSPGAGTDNPWDQIFFYININLLFLVICCKFLPLNDFLKVFPI